MTFLEFLESRKSIEADISTVNEAYKQSDLKKVGNLIANLLEKETGNKIRFIWTEQYTMDGKPYIAQMFGDFIKSEKQPVLQAAFSINYGVDGTSNNPDSVSFYDIDSFLHDYAFKLADTSVIKVNAVIKIKGASAAHFIPIIARVIKTGKMELTQEEAEKLAQSVYEGVNADFFNKSGVIQWGNLKYNVFDTILECNHQKLTHMINESNKDTELGREKLVAGQKMRAAVANGDRDAAKHFRKQYLTIIDAMKGGATTMKELEVYIERNKKASFNVSSVVAQKSIDAFHQEEKKQSKDPEVAFKEMRGYLNMVTSGIQPGLIICGAPGIGKTYRVTKFLKSKGYDVDKGNLHIIKGKCTTRNLYLDLYNFRERGDIILIDDADSLIGPKAPEDTINLLKAALDSNDGGGRLVSYRVGGRLTDDDGQEVPKSFKYNGSIIVLTNYNVGQIDTAVKGRVFTQDMDFSTTQLLDLVKKIMPGIGEGTLSSTAKMKAYDCLSELAEDGTNMEVSLRSFITCARLYQMGEDNPDFSDDDIKSMIKDQVEHQAMRGGKKY